MSCRMREMFTPFPVLYLCRLFFLAGIPSAEETMGSLLTVIQSSSQSQLVSQQYLECPVGGWNSGGNSNSTTSSNGQVEGVSAVCSYRKRGKMGIHTCAKTSEV